MPKESVHLMKSTFFLTAVFSFSAFAMENDKLSQFTNLNLNNSVNNELAEFKQRRTTLLSLVEKQHKKTGPILLVAGFDQELLEFEQEKSFYYYTGIVHPGLTLMLEQNKSSIYAPKYLRDPLLWTDYSVVSQETVQAAGIDEFLFIGKAIEPGCTSALCDSPEHYANLISNLKKRIQEKQTIYSLNSTSEGLYNQHITFLRNLMKHVPGLESSLKDISPLVAHMRRTKSALEIQKMEASIALSIKGFNKIAPKIRDGLSQTQIRTKIESVFTACGAQPAYYSIVGSGDTIHYLHPKPSHLVKVKNGDLVLIDAGARKEYYCADLTRTFPVSGKFTERQKEIYNLVLATQQHLANTVKPGFYISNRKEADKSLNCIAKTFLKEHGGFDHCLPHGVSHHLGLDVHDPVTDWEMALKEGDVITIEPGIYIKDEQIGIRIEDNYLITENGAQCLSAALPKTVEEIEALMQSGKKNMIR
ncbi:MAG: Xaa-Pro aminopeptidase [Candidatus Dependentiae bacterium ADurb.Bin331]|nr:MAG: Xaa-Pro aminopeptidase [Candidatus Dependentiae bacterium ADurb.Bin331]